MKRSRDQASAEAVVVAAAPAVPLIDPVSVSVPALVPVLPPSEAVESAVLGAIGPRIYHYPYWTMSDKRIAWAMWIESPYFPAAWKFLGEQASRLSDAVVLTCAVNSFYHHYGSYEIQLFSERHGATALLALLRLPGLGDPANGLFKSETDYARAVDILERIAACCPRLQFVLINWDASDARYMKLRYYNKFWDDAEQELKETLDFAPLAKRLRRV